MRVGQALKSKGGRTYLKFDKQLVINEGDALFLSKPQDDIDYLVSQGKMTVDEGAAKKAKIPEFVLYNIKVANTDAQ